MPDLLAIVFSTDWVLNKKKESVEQTANNETEIIVIPARRLMFLLSFWDFQFLSCEVDTNYM